MIISAGRPGEQPCWSEPWTTFSARTGLVAGLAAIWLTVVIRKVATGSVPSLLMISAVVLTVQAAVVLATGELWLFLL